MRDGWVGTTLGEVMTEVKTRVSDPSTAGVERYVGLEHFDGGSPVLCRWGIPTDVVSGKTLFDRDDVLFGKLRPYLRKVASAPWPGICSTDVLALRSREMVTPRYLELLLSSEPVIAHAVDTSAGTRMPRTSFRALASFEFPLPPLTEQRRIVDLIEAVDDARRTSADAILVVESARSALREDITCAAEVAPEVALREVTTKIGSGATPRGGRAAYHQSGVPLIRSQNVHDYRFVSEGLAFIDTEQAARLDGVTVEAGDVLINITGASVNRVCVAPTWTLPARVNQHVAILRPDPAKLDTSYLVHLLRRNDIKARLDATSGSGTTRPALTKAQLEDLRIPVPPIAMQRSVAGLLDFFAVEVDALRRVVEKLDAARATLLHNLCTGEHEIPSSYDRLLEPA